MHEEMHAWQNCTAAFTAGFTPTTDFRQPCRLQRQLDYQAEHVKPGRIPIKKKDRKGMSSPGVWQSEWHHR